MTKHKTLKEMTDDELADEIEKVQKRNESPWPTHGGVQLTNAILAMQARELNDRLAEAAQRWLEQRKK
jgi:hypothetical protein